MDLVSFFQNKPSNQTVTKREHRKSASGRIISCKFICYIFLRPLLDLLKTKQQFIQKRSTRSKALSPYTIDWKSSLRFSATVWLTSYDTGLAIKKKNVKSWYKADVGSNDTLKFVTSLERSWRTVVMRNI